MSGLEHYSSYLLHLPLSCYLGERVRRKRERREGKKRRGKRTVELFECSRSDMVVTFLWYILRQM